LSDKNSFVKIGDIKLNTRFFNVTLKCDKKRKFHIIHRMVILDQEAMLATLIAEPDFKSGSAIRVHACVTSKLNRTGKY
jgi:hypothetical protein